MTGPRLSACPFGHSCAREEAAILGRGTIPAAACAGPLLKWIEKVVEPYEIVEPTQFRLLNAG